jgi:glycosyltransferase involved in cell wall biosynthesis
VLAARERHKRVVLAVTGLYLGGTETQVTRLGLALKERGWDVRVLSLMPGGHYTSLLEDGGVPVTSLGMVRGRPSLRALLLALRLLRSWRPAALLCFGFHANLLGRFVRHPAGVPVTVSSVRNERFGGRLREIVLRLTDVLADVTVTNSELVAQHLRRRKVVTAGKLRVIPNAIAAVPRALSSAEREQLRVSLGIQDGDFMWLAVGRAEEQKDYPTLMAAFAQVVAAEPAARLCIAGRDPDGVVKNLVEAEGVERHCRLLGVRPDVGALLDACDAFVAASAWEGLPNSVMEALAASRAVVATRVGGIPELVEHGVSGVLVEPGQPAPLAAAMLELMRQPPQRRAAMGERGQERVLAKCALATVVGQWEELILELTARRGLRLT